MINCGFYALGIFSSTRFFFDLSFSLYLFAHSMCKIIQKNSLKIIFHISFFYCSMQLQCKCYSRPNPLHKYGGFLLKFTVRMYLNCLRLVWLLFHRFRGSCYDQCSRPHRPLTLLTEKCECWKRKKTKCGWNIKSTSTPFSTTYSLIKCRILNWCAPYLFV